MKRPWCWERLKAEGDDRGWDDWMASPTQWIWVWASFRIWWWTGKPGMLHSMESQRVGHDWATELSWAHPLMFFLVTVHSHILNVVSVLCNKTLLFIRLIYAALHLLIQALNLPLSHPYPLATTGLFSVSVSLLLCTLVHSCHILDSTNRWCVFACVCSVVSISLQPHGAHQAPLFI